MEYFIGMIVLVGIYKLFTGEDKDSSSYNNNSNKIAYKDIETGKTVKRKQRKARNIVQIDKPENFILNEEIKEILHLLENTKNNIFLTGKAGTGKSTLLKYFRATTKKSIAVVAPTGIAAINVQGQTVHSFFGFGIDITPERIRRASNERLKVIKSIDMLVIDEISMVRADLFECLDRSLKLNRRSQEPFGGVQLVVIGDLYQLPPVVKNNERRIFRELYSSAFFFGTQAYKNSVFIKRELSKVFRQSDSTFVDLLNEIRIAECSPESLEKLNEKVIDDDVRLRPDCVNLVTTNAIASEINTSRLEEIDSPIKKYTGLLSGEFKEKDIPVPLELHLKIGATVMLLNNDKEGRWVNGDVVRVLELKTDSAVVEFEDDDTVCNISVNSWENIKFIYDEEEKKVLPKKIGEYIQLPMKLAWALTIHKSQGQSIKYVHLNIGNGAFAAGQTYVALSRCTSFEGLSLESPIMPQDIFVNDEVREFMGFVQQTTASNVSKDNFELTSSNASERLGPTRRVNGAVTKEDVLELIVKKPGLKARQIAREFGVERRLINQILHYELNDVVRKDENYKFYSLK